MCDLKPELWSEELCLEYALKYLINPRIKNAEVQRKVMQRFIDFYCFGTVPSGFTPKMIILDSVYLLTDYHDRDKLYWRQEFYKECEEQEEIGGVATALESDESINVRKRDLTDFIAKYSAMLEQEKIEAQKGEIGVAANSLSGASSELFNCRYLEDGRARLAETSFNILSSMTSDISFYTLKRLVCFLAMTFLTSLVNDEEMLTIAFKSYDYKYVERKDFFRIIPMYEVLPPIPCKIAIENASKIKDEEFRSAVAKIVLEFNRAKKANLELQSYLKHSVLCFF